MRMNEVCHAWVVYRMTLHGNAVGGNVVCERRNGTQSSSARPGYHILLHSGLRTERRGGKTGARDGRRDTTTEAESEEGRRPNDPRHLSRQVSNTGNRAILWIALPRSQSVNTLTCLGQLPAVLVALADPTILVPRRSKKIMAKMKTKPVKNRGYKVDDDEQIPVVALQLDPVKPVRQRDTGMVLDMEGLGGEIASGVIVNGLRAYLSVVNKGINLIACNRALHRVRAGEDRGVQNGPGRQAGRSQAVDRGAWDSGVPARRWRGTGELLPSGLGVPGGGRGSWRERPAVGH